MAKTAWHPQIGHYDPALLLWPDVQPQPGPVATDDHQETPTHDDQG